MKWITGIFLIWLNLTFGADHLDLSISEFDSVLLVDFKISKEAAELINHAQDPIYLWNINEFNHAYYMVGNGGDRENLWAGVGYSQVDESEYLIITVRNVSGQFGRYFPRNVTLNMNYNGILNPGTVQDLGFGIYPERTVETPKLKTVKRLILWATYFELGSNNLVLKILLKDRHYAISDFQPSDLANLDDGHLQIKLRASR